MTHPSAWWGRLAGDEPDNRLLHFLPDESGGFLLIGAADLADHHHGFGCRILLERIETVDEVGAVDRIAADSNAGSLADTGARHLVDDFIGERSRPAYEPHW